MLEHDVYAAFERHAQFRLEVEDARRARAQARLPGGRIELHCRLLDAFGRLMIAWGWRLRARYGAIETT